MDYYGIIVFAVTRGGQVNLCSYSAGGSCETGGYASILWNGSSYEYT